MASQKRDRYLKKKKTKLKNKSLLPSFFADIDEEGFLLSNARYQGPKLSALILDLAEPFFDKNHSFESIELACTLAILAWNMAVIPDSDFPFPNDANPKEIDFLKSVVIQKTQRFPLDKRIITDFFFDENTGSLVVHSAL